LTPEDELLKICGVFHMADGPEMIDLYKKNLRVMEETAPSFRDLQFIKVCLANSTLFGRPQAHHSCRTAPKMRSAPKHWVQNGAGSIISLTTIVVVVRTAFLTRAPASL
jgi:hypothetical protein